MSTETTILVSAKGHTPDDLRRNYLLRNLEGKLELTSAKVGRAVIERNNRTDRNLGGLTTTQIWEALVLEQYLRHICTLVKPTIALVFLEGSEWKAVTDRNVVFPYHVEVLPSVIIKIKVVAVGVANGLSVINLEVVK